MFKGRPALAHHPATRAARALTPGLVLVGLAGALTGDVAWADPGDHIRVGEAEIVPSLFMGVDWHSNVYRTAGEQGGEAEPIGGASGRVGPKLALELDGSDAEFKLWGAYQLRKFFNPNQANLDVFNETDVGLDLNLLPNAVVGFKTRDSYRITNYPTESTGAEDALLQRRVADVSGDLAVHPSAALNVDLGGFFNFTDYVGPTSLVNPRINSSQSYGPSLDLQWAFFPKTALIADFDLAFTRWENNILFDTGDVAGPEDLGLISAVPDSSTWKLETGLRGRFTQRLVLNFLVGYGMSTYDEASVTGDEAVGQVTDASELDAAAAGFDQDAFGLDTLLLNFSAQWRPREDHEVVLGYSKNFEDSWFTNYVAYHYVFSRYGLLIAKQVGLAAELGYRYEKYVGEVNRLDHFVRAKGGVSYITTDWMKASIDVGWMRRASADEVAVSTIEYDDVSVTGKLTFTY